MFTPKHLQFARKYLLPLLLFMSTLSSRAQSTAPHIISFYPDSARSYDTITIHGTHFAGTTAVDFGISNAQTFTVTNDSTISAVVGTGSSGKIKVTTSAGSDSLGWFTYIAPPPPVYPPVISSFSPTSGTTGDTITIVGAHFSNTTAVFFGGKYAAGFRLVSDSVIRAAVGTGLTGFIKIRSYDGDATDTVTTFHYTGTVPPLHLAWFDRTSAYRGQQVFISGISLTGTTSVKFGGVEASTFYTDGDSILIATVGAGATGQIKVTGIYGVDSLPGFTFIPDTTGIAPHIISFTPSSGTTGDTITISGSNFTGTYSVGLGGQSAHAFTVVSDSIIKAVVGTGVTGHLQVINPAGSDTTIAVFTYTGTRPAPHISSFSPTAATAYQTVTITGSALSGVTDVRFGGIEAYRVTVLSDTVIQATVDTGSTGLVYVSTPSGIDTIPGFTYVPPAPHYAPHIISFSPDSAATNDTVLIHGTHFLETTSVGFGWSTANSFAVVNDSLIYAVVGYGSTGKVWVTTPGGTDSLAGFTYISHDTTPVTPPANYFQLLSFTGSSASNHPVLLWKTANEQAIRAYVIQYSSDSLSFSDLDSVAALHVDSMLYTYADPTTRAAVSYYRLKIIDTLGAVSYSYTITVQPSGTAPEMRGYPNPSVNGIFSVVPPNPLVKAKFTLSDMNGKTILTIDIQPNTPLVKINTTGLNKGVYKLVWSDGRATSSQTVLIL